VLKQHTDFGHYSCKEKIISLLYDPVKESILTLFYLDYNTFNNQLKKTDRSSTYNQVFRRALILFGRFPSENK